MSTLIPDDLRTRRVIYPGIAQLPDILVRLHGLLQMDNRNPRSCRLDWTILSHSRRIILRLSRAYRRGCLIVNPRLPESRTFCAHSMLRFPTSH